jgi:hypothetical protein
MFNLQVIFYCDVPGCTFIIWSCIHMQCHLMHKISHNSATFFHPYWGLLCYMQTEAAITKSWRGSCKFCIFCDQYDSVWYLVFHSICGILKYLIWCDVKIGVVAETCIACSS